MVIRQNIRCTICQRVYTLRISIGSGKTQQHSFKCEGCEQTLSVKFEKVYASAGFKNVEYGNCEGCDEEGVVVNLHPDFVIPADKVHQDGYFASFDLAETLNKHGLFEKFEEHAKSHGGATRATQGYYDALMQEKNIQDPADLFELGLKVMSLYASNKGDLAQGMVQVNASKYGLAERTTVAELLHLLFLSAGTANTRRVAAALDEAWTQAKAGNEGELQALWKYLQETHNDEIVRGALEMLSAFGKHYREFLPLKILIELDEAIPDDVSVSAIGFDDTKMMYGDAYEILTSGFVVPALLNNIIQGRSFGTFEQLNLAQYLKLDKAGRHICFAKNSILQPLYQGLENQIRNASHHKQIVLSPKTGRISYRAGKGDRRHYMTYATYLSKTVLVIQSLLGLADFLVQKRETQ